MEFVESDARLKCLESEEFARASARTALRRRLHPLYWRWNFWATHSRLRPVIHFDDFRVAILLRCGGLQLHPSS